jgi:hypothetical protein
VTHEGLKAWLIDYHRKKQAQNQQEQLLLMQQQQQQQQQQQHEEDHPDDPDEMDDPEWFEREDRAREERQERAELLTAVNGVNTAVTEINTKLERCLECMEGFRRDVGETKVAATEMENEIVKMSRKINKITSSEFWKNKLARINADAADAVASRVAPVVQAIEAATCKLLTARNASSAPHVPMVSVTPRMVPVNPVAQEAALVPHPAHGFTTTAEAAATASATMGPLMNFSAEGLDFLDDDDFMNDMTRAQFGTYA